MNIEYKVKNVTGNIYKVIKITTIYGERTSAYESEPNKIKKEVVYKGCPADCESFIRLHEGGYIIKE